MIETLEALRNFDKDGIPQPGQKADEGKADDESPGQDG